MELIDITSNSFARVKKGKWLLLFWVPWGKPSFDQIDLIKRKNPKAMSVALINAEENKDIASKYNVFIYPTIIILDHGVENRRLVGFHEVIK